jgi:hypothetical protein
MLTPLRRIPRVPIILALSSLLFIAPACAMDIAYLRGQSVAWGPVSRANALPVSLALILLGLALQLLARWFSLRGRSGPRTAEATNGLVVAASLTRKHTLWKMALTIALAGIGVIVALAGTALILSISRQDSQAIVVALTLLLAAALLNAVIFVLLLVLTTPGSLE